MADNVTSEAYAKAVFELRKNVLNATLDEKRAQIAQDKQDEVQHAFIAARRVVYASESEAQHQAAMEAIISEYRYLLKEWRACWLDLEDAIAMHDDGDDDELEELAEEVERCREDYIDKRLAVFEGSEDRAAAEKVTAELIARVRAG